LDALLGQAKKRKEKKKEKERKKGPFPVKMALLVRVEACPVGWVCVGWLG
jgi:hypothetical protein